MEQVLFSCQHQALSLVHEEPQSELITEISIIVPNTVVL